jgi:transcriptional antiterminator RfaH
MPHWYLVHTKPANELVAELNLARQGYEIYYPRAVRSSRRGGRLREQVVALFPRYLFLCLDEGRQSLAPVSSTLGVAAVVRFGQRYALVPDRVVRDLRARADAETGLHKLQSALALQPGMCVQVTAGPFDGLEGVFEREAGSDRVVLLLTLLGQLARVQVSVDAVVPVNVAA